MHKKFDFGINEEMEITAENVGGIAIKFNVLNTDNPAVVPAIADYNEVSVSLVLNRAGKKPRTIFNSFLDTVLTGFFAQTPKLALNKKEIEDEGYLVFIDFNPYVFGLNKGDSLIFRMKAQESAFAGTLAANSKIEVETLPVMNGTNVIPCLKSKRIGDSEDNLDFELGDNVVKATIVTDYTAAYDESNKAKVESIEVAALNFNKSINENALIAQNMHYLDQNPESDVQNLVAYLGDPLRQARLKAKLSDGADSQAEVVWVRLEKAY